ncbi:MAG: mechanosensitive ion channel [Betaproteobacteria bacterium]|nr:mechanosensitive ion channel [Betaproteobacteria bacterium]
MSTMTANPLWVDLQVEFDRPDLLLQVLVLGGCVLAGWLLSQQLMKKFSARHDHYGIFQVPFDSFQIVLTPLLIVVLMALAALVMGRWQHAGLLRIVLPLLLSFLLIRAGFFLLRKAFAKEGRVGVFLQVFEQSFAVLVWSGLALYITGLWPDFVQYLEDTTVPLGRHREPLIVILQALLWVLITLVLAMWAATALEQRLMHLDTMHSSLRAVMARVVRASLILIAVLVSLSIVGIDLTVLSVFGGALGVGIGLGLQKLVSSYVSGFVILLERSLSIGDIVHLDRFNGEVAEINTRYTLIKSPDGAAAVIPNEMLVSSPIQNLARGDRQLRLATTLMVGPDTDLEALLPDMVEAMQRIPRILKTPAPTAVLARFTAEGMELEAGFWIVDPQNGMSNVRSEVNFELWHLCRQHRVRLPGQAKTEPPVRDETDKSLIRKPLSADSDENQA